jgi:hypothetical protein
MPLTSKVARVVHPHPLLELLAPMLLPLPLPLLPPLLLTHQPLTVLRLLLALRRVAVLAVLAIKVIHAD